MNQPQLGSFNHLVDRDKPILSPGKIFDRNH